jgi:hypothetical protein
VLLAASTALVLNAFWLVPLWRFQDLRTASSLFMTPGSPRDVLRLLAQFPVEGYLSVWLLALGSGGLLCWWREGRRARVATFAGSAAVLLGLSVFGGLDERTRLLEPFRFMLTLQLLLALPAATLICQASVWLAARAGRGFRGALAIIATGSLALGLSAAAAPQAMRGAAERLLRVRPLVVGIPAEGPGLVDWLRNTTDQSARILFEDQLRLLEATDIESTHWTPLLPLLLQPETRLFIGGLYQTAFIAHHRLASFGDYHLGDRRIDEWTQSELTDYCARYNVGWVVCWSPLSRFSFDRFALARRIGTLPRAASPERAVVPDEVQWRAIAARAGSEVANRYLSEGVNRYALYRVERPRSYFLQGRGRLTTLDANRVELADVTPDEGSVVVSLHWLDAWRTDPPLAIEPAPVGGDPVPFVRIHLPGPQRRIVLRNGYGGP